MTFYVIAASPADTIVQIQNNALFFHLVLIKGQLALYQIENNKDKIYEINVKEYKENG